MTPKMICPFCDSEMEEGVLVATSKILWVSLSEAKKGGLAGYFRKGVKEFLGFDPLVMTTRQETAFICRNCNIVTGLFPVKDQQTLFSKKTKG